MKVFVTGVSGQLGHDVMNELIARGYDGIGSDIQPSYSGVEDASAVTRAPYACMDITHAQEVSDCIERICPDAIIHCAAWTNVDGAEAQENHRIVHEINAEGSEHIARAAQKAGAKLLFISTDYVFDGKGERPWKPEDETFSPLNVYGQSKLDGERAIIRNAEKYFIVRIAWVFGLNGKNFIKTMINAGKTRTEVRVVSDQIGTPTYTRDLARLLVDMLETEKYGIYHATNAEAEPDGFISWYDLCCEAYRLAGLNTKVIPVTTEEYGRTVAARPFNSRLDKSKIIENGFVPLPSWRDAVKRYIEEAGLCISEDKNNGTD